MSLEWYLELGAAWFPGALSILWQGSLLLLAAAGLTALLQNSSAAVRAEVWTYAFFGILYAAALVGLRWLPRTRIPELELWVNGLSWAAVLGCVWLAVSLLLLLRLPLGRIQRRRLLKQSRGYEEPGEDLRETFLYPGKKVDRPAELREGPGVDIPMTWGIAHRVVLLPESFETWPERRRKAALLHELAHLRRDDGLKLTVAYLVCALFWPNPLAWLALRRLRSESELASDDVVVRFGVSAGTYAEDLLAVARSLTNPRSPVGAMPLLHRSQLPQRIDALLDRRRRRYAVSRWWPSGTVMFIWSWLLIGTSNGAEHAPLKEIFDAEVHRVDLGELRALSGAAHAEEHGPIRAARITLRRETDDGLIPAELHVTTSSDGSFSFDGLPPGLYTLQGDAWGFVRREVQHLDLYRGEIRDAQLVFERGASVGGLVLSGEPPLRDLSIRAFGPGESEARGRFRAHSRFEIGGLTPGTWRLEISSKKTGRSATEYFRIKKPREKLKLDVTLEAASPEIPRPG